MAETLRGYDAWLTAEPGLWTYGECEVCGDDMYDADDIYWNFQNVGHLECFAIAYKPCADCRKARCACP